MQAEFEAKEWGVCGELLTPSAEPASPVSEPFVIPPPPWSENYDPALDPDHEPASKLEEEDE
jgi:hypothetical protein